MLESRTLTTAYDDIRIEGQLVQGCPEEGILSPLLCFVIDDLLEELKNEVFLAYGYADDMAIIIRDKIFRALRDRVFVLSSSYWKDGVARPGCP